MGYSEAASSLSRESHYELESPSVAAFRQAILDGQWTDAEAILLGPYSCGDEMASAASSLLLDGPGGLVLAEGADKSQMLFRIRQQKFLEYLDRRDLSKALAVLRQELTPLNHDVHQLHSLSRQVLRVVQCWRQDVTDALKPFDVPRGRLESPSKMEWLDFRFSHVTVAGADK